MRVTPQSLPIPQTQAPSAPSSSPCPENAEKKASEAESEWLHWPYPTTRKPWCIFNRVPLCLGYPVHRSIPPTRRSSSDESLVPGEAQDKPQNPHANLSLSRATRKATKGLRVASGDGVMRSPVRGRVVYTEIEFGPGSKVIGAPTCMFSLTCSPLYSG